ncbi:MAG: GumC family protein, partial [Rhodothermales bacterium]|nr:GumC family protein [Rhodothermales bacterium]
MQHSPGADEDLNQFFIETQNMPNSHIEDRYSDQVAQGAPAAERTRPSSYVQPYPGGSQSDTKEQIENVVDLLYRRKWGILLIFVLIVGGVAAYTFTRTPLYQTASFVMVDLGSGPIAGELSLLGESSATQRSSTGRSLSTELFVLQSSGKIYQRVRDRLTQRPDLAEEDFAGSDQTGEANFPIGSASFTPATREVGNAIAVTAVSPNPEDAALLANIYAEEYVQLTKEASRTNLSAQVEFLEEQEAERLVELRAAEEAVKAYTTQNGAIALGQETSNLVSQIASLEARQDESRIELRMREQSFQSTQDELERISPRLVERFASTVDQDMAAARAEIARLQDQKNTILLQNPGLTNSNPRIAEINGKIDDLKSQLEGLSRQYVREVTEAGGIPGSESNLSYITELKRRSIQDQIEIDGLRSRIDMMGQQLADNQVELNNIPELSLELARLERTRQHADQLYQRVVAQLQQARLAEQSEPGYAEVIRDAVVPTTPFFPDPKRNMMLGLFFGLMLGLGWAIVRDRLDNRIYKPDQLRKTGRPVSG